MDIIQQVSRATALQGHLVTLRTENRTCLCGKEFTAHIRVVDGVDNLDGMTECQGCRTKRSEARWREESLAKIPSATATQEVVWEEQCNLPTLFWGKTFANYDRKIQPKAFDLLSKYKLIMEEDSDPLPHSVVLLSPNVYGVGKTHLVAALIQKIIKTTDKLYIFKDGDYRKEPCPVFFTSENKLLSRIRQTFNRKNQPNDQQNYEETEEDIYNELDSYDLLALDDVGKVRPRDYNFLQGVYFRIIDSRYSNEKPIILTTNLDYAELEAHIGGACADRLREMCGETGFVKMSGKSYRQKGTKNELPSKS